MLPSGGDLEANKRVLREQARRELLAAGATEAEADLFSSFEKMLEAARNGTIEEQAEQSPDDESKEHDKP